MKVVVASDKYKGSLSTIEVANHIESGIKRASKDIDIIKIPMADGGEGTVHSIIMGLHGRIIEKEVLNPLNRRVKAYLGILEDNTAIIEMAAASGLALLSENEYDPMRTTTYGFGELIKYALDLGCRRLVLGIGGSATNDCGAGMLSALGMRFLDMHGNDVDCGGGSLSEVVDIDTSNFDPRLLESKITVACDVDNPLCGPKGASYVYGFQKGANKEMVEKLDNNLLHFGHIIEKITAKEVINIPGAGAAGGLGAALIAFLNVDIRKGIDMIIELTGLENIIKSADIVITGEGRIDHQTLFGKTPYGVAQIAKKFNVPVIAIAGSIGDGYEALYNNGFNAIFSIMDKPMTLNQAVENAGKLLEAAAERIFRLLMINNRF